MNKLLTNDNEPLAFSAKDNFCTILNDLRRKEGDDLVEEFIKIFSNRIPTDIGHLTEARNNQNFQELKRKVHFLSTTLITLGFHYGLSLTKEIENAIDAKDFAETLTLTDEFIEYLNDALNNVS